AWMRHWIAAGCTSIEAILATDAAGKFCVGDSPTLADCCLVPQVYNARRLGLDLSPYPTLLRIDAACRVLEPFRRAVPEVQPGAPAPA
ncbi:MAG: glutathione S-transferase C-terminal domain-containing protein, partial [Gammaproteobacteria bacterium]